MAERRSGVTRRAVLRGAVGVGAGVAAGALRPSFAFADPGPSVAVFGGGVAGLTAAHELAERGFAVTVYERRALGGKARSIPFGGTGTGGRPDLPGEHGFRFFPGFYHHLPDTMRRIPFAGNSNGVWDNLISTPEARFARKDADSTFIPTSYSDLPWTDPGEFQQTLGSVIATTADMPPADAEYFANRLLVYMTSCDDRRLGQWEKVAWRDFVGANQRSEDFRILLSRTLTTMLVAMSDDQASTRTIGTMGEQFLGNPLWQGNDGPMDRVLNGPTNQAWIDPWLDRLRALGVTFVTAELAGLDLSGTRLSGARLTDGTPVTADHYVLAVPAEVARTFWTPEILAVQPELAEMSRLTVEWMTGIQFYLNRPANVARGHTAYVDSPWSLTSISQNQFWARTKLPTFGDGTVQDCLSIDVSNWNVPGVLYGKPARECTHDEIAREVWAQVKEHLTGDDQLTDADLHSWFLDPGVAWDPSRAMNTNADPLLVNTIGTWSARPKSHGAVDNLFLAGDYVQTTIDLATMEGANESARSAVNALLDATGSSAPRCRMFSLFRSPVLEPLRQNDIARYAAGQPNIFDAG